MISASKTLRRALVLLALALAAVPVLAQPRLMAPNQWNELAGDSWTNQNAAVTSRYPGNSTCSQTPCGATTGIYQPADGWDYQLGALTGMPYTNRGYGGQTSGTVYQNIAAAIALDPRIAEHNWTYLLGRNDVTNPGGEAWPAVAQGTYSITVTATLTNNSSSITGVSPSLATTPGGTISGWTISGVAGLPTGANVSGTGTTLTLSGYSGGSNVVRNFTGVTGSYSVTLTAPGVTQFLSLVPHQRKVIILPYGGTSAAGADWVRWVRLKWWYWRNVPQYTFFLPRYWMGVYPNGALQDGTEDQTVAQQGIPASESFTAHPNYRATPKIAAGLAPVMQAMRNRAVYANDRTIPDVPVDIANGATIGQLYGYGNITSWTKVSDDCSGCISISPSGLVTRNGTGALPIVHATIRADGLDHTGAAVSSPVNNLRILPTIVGSAAPWTPIGATLPLDTNSYAIKMWPKLVPSAHPLPNSGKLTLVFCIKPSASVDNVNANIYSTGGQVIVNKSSGNKIIITLKDTAQNAIISSWTSVTTNYTSSGYQWFLFSIDITGAGTISAYSVGPTGTVTPIAPAVSPTVGTGQIGMTTLGNLPGLFSSTPAGSATFGGGIKLFYAVTGTALDFSNSTNRGLFVDGSGNPVSLGTNCSTPTGAQPEICFMGAAGDWVTGKNFGSATDFGWNDNWLLGLTGSSDPTPP